MIPKAAQVIHLQKVFSKLRKKASPSMKRKVKRIRKTKSKNTKLAVVQNLKRKKMNATNRINLWNLRDKR